VHGFDGVGLGFDGQLNTATCGGGLLPTGNIKLWDTGGGRKFAVTENDEFMVNVQAAAAPKLAHAPPQPAKVDGDVADSVSVSIVPFV
jgi:hypothetical protein